MSDRTLTSTPRAGRLDRMATATGMGMLDQVRRPLLLVLLILVPIIFITWAARVTPTTPRQMKLPDGSIILTNMRALLTVIDVPVAVTFLAGLVGVFVVGAALAVDRRLVVAGFSPGEAVTPRLVVLATVTLVITAISLIMMAISFTPKQWGPFIGGCLLVGLTYGGIGALAGAFLGRLGAVYLMFFLPNIDIGIAQDPLFFNGDPQVWARFLPGYGGTRMIVEASFSGEFALSGALAPALGWLVAVGIAVVVLLRLAVAPRR